MTRRDKRTLGVLASSLAIVGIVASAAAAAGTFVDDDGNVHEANIEAIAAAGITKGCNPPTNDLYCPTDPVTRGQMAAFLVRALGYSDDGGGDLFSDDDGHIFEADIDKLGAAGVTKGCNPPANTNFCPDDFVTRGQMAAFLVRALGYSDDGGGDLFSDDDGHIFEADIDKLGAAGVTKGCNPPANTNFCPSELVLRDQMASFLARALDLDPIQPIDLISYTGQSIWLTDAASSFADKLADRGFAPQFSPDGTMIGYLDDTCDPNDLCIDAIPIVRVVTLDGSPVASFDAGAILSAEGLAPGVFGFSWTPDGMIAIDAGVSVNGGDRGIWVVNLDGTHIEEIVNDPGAHEAAPIFSPDGTKVAYQSGGSNVAVFDLNSGVTRTFALSANAYFGVRKYAWSPNGGFLALPTNAGSNFALFVYNFSTSLGGSIAFGTDTYFSDPGWSPDGTKLLFASDLDGDIEIFEYEFTNLDATDFGFLDGELTQLTQNQDVSDSEASWSPSGDQIVFTSEDAGGGVFVMRADGSDIVKVASGSNPRWEP